MTSKTYKIDQFISISQVIVLIMKRFKITAEEAARFTLTTMAGEPLNPTTSLSSYGVGSILPKWQLKVKKNSRGLVRVDTLLPQTAAKKTSKGKEKDSTDASEGTDFVCRKC